MEPHKLPPHLISDGDNKHCSACNLLFRTAGDGSLSQRFAQHIRARHKPEEEKGDEKQADSQKHTTES